MKRTTYLIVRALADLAWTPACWLTLAAAHLGRRWEQPEEVDAP